MALEVSFFGHATLRRWASGTTITSALRLFRQTMMSEVATRSRANGVRSFPATTTYFGDAGKNWMINFRVRDLDAMATQLRAKGISVEIDQQDYPNGKFAHLSDLEGNPIELWPAGRGVPH